MSKLDRFLESKIGCNVNKVYSEYLRKFKKEYGEFHYGILINEWFWKILSNDRLNHYYIDNNYCINKFDPIKHPIITYWYTFDKHLDNDIINQLHHYHNTIMLRGGTPEWIINKIIMREVFTCEDMQKIFVWYEMSNDAQFTWFSKNSENSDFFRSFFKMFTEHKSVEYPKRPSKKERSINKKIKKETLKRYKLYRKEKYDSIYNSTIEKLEEQKRQEKIENDVKIIKHGFDENSFIG